MQLDDPHQIGALFQVIDKILVVEHLLQVNQTRILHQKSPKS